MDDAIGVDVKGYFNLRHASGCCGDPVQMEHAQSFIVLSPFRARPAAHGSQPRSGRRQRWRTSGTFLRRDGGIAVNDLGAYAAQGFQTQGQGRNIQQQQAFDLAAQNAALNGRADGNTFIRVNAFKRFFASKALHRVLYRRDTGGTADQQDLIQISIAFRPESDKA